MRKKLNIIKFKTFYWNSKLGKLEPNKNNCPVDPIKINTSSANLYIYIFLNKEQQIQEPKNNKTKHIFGKINDLKIYKIVIMFLIKSNLFSIISILKNRVFFAIK